MHLSFEVPKGDPKTEGQELEIFFDSEGLELLVLRLNTLLRKKKGHDHLMTPAWAGNELSEEKKMESNGLIHHVTMTLFEP